MKHHVEICAVLWLIIIQYTYEQAPLHSYGLQQHVQLKHRAVHKVLQELSHAQAEEAMIEEKARVQRLLALEAKKAYERDTGEEMVQMVNAKISSLRAEQALRKVMQAQDTLKKIDEEVFEAKLKNNELARSLIKVENDLINAQIEYISNNNESNIVNDEKCKEAPGRQVLDILNVNNYYTDSPQEQMAVQNLILRDFQQAPIVTENPSTQNSNIQSNLMQNAPGQKYLPTAFYNGNPSKILNIQLPLTDHIINSIKGGCMKQGMNSSNQNINSLNLLGISNERLQKVKNFQLIKEKEKNSILDLNPAYFLGSKTNFSVACAPGTSEQLKENTINSVLNCNNLFDALYSNNKLKSVYPPNHSSHVLRSVHSDSSLKTSRNNDLRKEVLKNSSLALDKLTNSFYQNLMHLNKKLSSKNFDVANIANNIGRSNKSLRNLDFIEKKFKDPFQAGLYYGNFYNPVNVSPFGILKEGNKIMKSNKTESFGSHKNKIKSSVNKALFKRSDVSRNYNFPTELLYSSAYKEFPNYSKLNRIKKRDQNNETKEITKKRELFTNTSLNQNINRMLVQQYAANKYNNFYLNKRGLMPKNGNNTEKHSNNVTVLQPMSLNKSAMGNIKLLGEKSNFTSGKEINVLDVLKDLNSRKYIKNWNL